MSYEELLTLDPIIICAAFVIEFIFLLGTSADVNVTLLAVGPRDGLDLLFGNSIGASSSAALVAGDGLCFIYSFISSYSLTYLGTTSITVPKPGCGYFFFRSDVITGGCIEVLGTSLLSGDGDLLL